MLVKEIIDIENGTKYEIYKNNENDYSYKYFEYFQSCGWRQIGKEQANRSKDLIEWEFDIKVA